MESKEILNIQIESTKWAAIVRHCNLEVNTDYLIKSVRIEDDLFKDDLLHKQLKKDAAMAYKKLNDYEFNQRNPRSHLT